MNYTREALIPVAPRLPSAKHLHRTFQGIPSIACSPQGRLFAVWYAGGDSECRDNYVLLSVSDDEGQTWIPAAVVDPPHPDVRAYDSTLWFSPDGKLRWFWAQGCGGESGTWDIQDGAGGVFASVIENFADDIRNFRYAPPRRISDGVMMNKPAVFSDGSWVYPVCVWSLATVAHPEMHLEPGCRMSVSRDGGETLEVRGKVNFTQMPCGADETEEHNFVERRDGSIVVWGRAFSGMGEAVSFDRGATWSKPYRPEGFFMTNSRMCVRRLPSGKLLQIFNDAGDAWPKRYTKRTRLTARLSDDDGRTWTGGLVLDERDLVAYPDADCLTDGSICAIYDHDRMGSGEILFARFTEEDILAGKPVSAQCVLKRVVDRSGGVPPTPPERKLENDLLRIEFTETGRLKSFFSKRTRTDYARLHGLWRLIVNQGSSLEVELNADREVGTVRVEGDAFRIDYDDPATPSGERLPIHIGVTGKLAGDDLELGIEIESRITVPGDLVRECHFPILGLSPDVEHRELRTSCTGHFPDLRAKLEKLGREYTGMDHVYTRDLEQYPGSSASVNCYLIFDDKETLYVGCHDPGFEFTHHLRELEAGKGVNVGMVRLPFLAPGRTCRLEHFHLAVCAGSWEHGADRYRAWLDTWYRPLPVPAHVRNMAGWQRIIFRSQYGENFYTFDDIPRIVADGLTAGIDTLLVFGWHTGGHDNDYPNYTVSEDLGGREKLRTAIARAHAMGGRIILYANGQLIDPASDFYRTGSGQKIAIKTPQGVPALRFYGFSGRGIFAQAYGKRAFATACPVCETWHAEMRKVIELAAELGCDGIFLDQLGMESALCCDPAHGHPVPYFGIMNARSEMVRVLQAYAHEKGLSFGIENTSDVTCRYADYIHSVWGGNAVTNPDYEAAGEKPFIRQDAELFRYLFPELPFSNREIRDDTDIERRVNRMLLLGQVSDVEIFRCQRTIAATPHYREYLKQANDFRARHPEWRAARYRAGALHVCDSPELDSAGFAGADGTVYVFVTQSFRPETAGRVTVPGCRFAGADTLGDAQVSADGAAVIRKHGAALLKFIKEGVRS